MMKKLSGLLLLALAITFVSCKKDDDTDKNPTNPNNNGSFTQAYYIDYGSANNDIYMFSSGVTFNADTIYGTGDALYFETWSSVDGQIAPGFYTIDSTASGDPMTISYAAWASNYNFATEVGTDSELVSGAITVSNSGTTFTIAYDVTNDSGTNLKGTYTGTIVEIQ